MIRNPIACVGVFAAIFSFFASLAAQPSGEVLEAGPMIGHVSDSSTTVWLRMKPGSDIAATARQGGSSLAPEKIENIGNGSHLIRFTELEPATRTEVEVVVSRGEESVEEKVSFSTAPAPGSTGTVRVAFGSCSKLSQHDEGPIYEAIADERPDFAVFVGDNVYFIVGDGSDRHFATTGPVGDWNFFESMLVRHLQTRMHPDLQRMLRTVPSYAVWDDHDYGPNNADSTFEMKEEATRAFKQVWANPSYGTASTPGIFSSFRHGPVEVFLMDNRTHKYSGLQHDDVTREEGRIWGEGQLQWLLEGLKASTAPVKLIANGTQFLSTSRTGEGHFQEAMGERTRLLEFLEEEGIGGVVFLTGDRHFSEAMEQAQPAGALVLEFTSSPLQQGREVGTVNRQNDNQIWSMGGNSYGLVTVDIPEEGAGTIRFEARDEQNDVVKIDSEERATTWTLRQLEY